QRALFMREAQLASHLEHPHIVTVSEVGERDGTLFLVMRLVEGRPLSERLGEPSFCPTVRSRVEFLRKTVAAVHYAHQRGVIHRDLKPGNILVDEAGDPAVGDFGLARWLAQESTVTLGDGAMIGTPAFMPPEHAGQEREDPTVAGDIWSLGVILYLMLAGRVPFEAPTLPATVHKILHDHPPGPFRFSARAPRPGVAPGELLVHPPTDVLQLSNAARRDLESVCLRCLEKRPAARYGTAGELAQELQRWLEGIPVQARPAGAMEVTVRWVVRRPALAAVIGLGAVALGALLLSAWQRQVNVRTERLRQVFNYVADMNLAQRGLQESNAVIFERAMAATVPIPGGEDFRGVELGLLRREAATLFPSPWFEAGEPLYQISVAPGGDRVATVGSRHVYLLDASGALLQRWVVEAAETAAAVALNPAGDQIAAGTVRGVELLTPGRTNRLQLGGGRISQLAWSEDGRWLATVGRPNPTNDTTQIEVFDALEGRSLGTLSAGPISLRWTSTGLLRFSTYIAEVFEWDPRKPAAQRLQPNGYRSPMNTLSPGAERLARTSIYGSVHVIEVGSGQVSTLGHGFLGDGARLVFSPEGRRLAGTSLGGTVQVLTLEGGTNLASVVSVSPGHGAALSSIAFARDGTVLFSSGLDGTLRRLALPPEPRRAYEVVEHQLLTGAGIGPTFSPDGRWIALLESRGYRGSQAEESTLLWDTQGQRVAGRLGAEVVAWGPQDLALTWDFDARLRMWNLADPAQPRELARFRLNPDQDWRLDTKLTGNGRWLVSVGNRGVLQAYDTKLDRFTFLDAATIPPRESFPGRSRPGSGSEQTTPTGVTKPDFGFLECPVDTPWACVTISDGRVVLWNIAEHRVIPLTRASVSFLAYSSDGRWLALMDVRDQFVQLFDGRTGAKEGELHGHESVIQTAVFTPDGRQLVTGGADNALVIWNLETRREVYRQQLDAAIVWLRVSGDGQWLVSSLLPNRFLAAEGRPRPGTHRLWRLLPPVGRTRQIPGDVPSDSIWARYREVAARHPAEVTNAPPTTR
ncbi:MAG: protein kinase, partial [Verrucomicrobiales bacterium]|nr:protein kinase [Verrucomicrobiales bacterium]